MKIRFNCAILASIAYSSGLAHAVDQTWKTDGISNTWNTTDLNWDAGSAWTNGNTAVFAGTGEAVTVATVTAAGVTFSGTGYTLAGGTITSSGSIAANEDVTISSAIVLGANQGWSAAAGRTLILGGVTSGTATLTYGGSGSYVIGGINSNSGNLAINAATVKVNTGATLFCASLGWAGRNVTISNGGVLEAPNFGNGNGNLWGQCGDGANNVILQGGGVFKMTGSTMDSTVNKGFDVSAGNTGYFRVPTGTSTVWNGRNTSRDFNANTGATLIFDGGGNFETQRYIRGAGNVTKNDGGTLKLTDVNAFTGTLTINGGTVDAAKTTTGGSGSSLGGGSNTIVVNSGGTLKITGARGAGYHSGAVTIHGGTITMDGSDLSFCNARTLTFDTSAGIINGGPSGQWRRRDANNKIAVTAAASGSTISVADLNLYDSNPVIDVADGAQDADLTISSAISGGSGLVKSGGGGTLVLTGMSSPGFTGATTVNAGTLRVNGSLGAGSVTVNAGTLEGSGTVPGLVTVNSGGSLTGSLTLSSTVNANAGSTVSGTPTFDGAANIGANAVLSPAGTGSLGTVTANGTLILAGETRMEITKTGAILDSDRIAGTAAVTLGGTLKISASGDSPQLGDTFQLFTGTGGFSGSFNSIEAPALDPGLSWDFTQLATTGSITVVNFAAAPSFSKPAGGFIGAQSITLASEAGATIYYTTDGTAPTLSSPSGPSPVVGISVPDNSTVTIRAFATKPGQANSAEVTATYTTISTAVWNVDANGLWSDSANWLQNAIPDGATNPVDFQTTAQSGDTTVTLDSSRTAGTLTFGNVNPFNWTIVAANAAVLTLDNGASVPGIAVASNTATIAAPIAGSNGLALTGPGTLVLAGANTYAGDTSITGGSTLKLGASNTLPDGVGKGSVLLSGVLDMATASDTVNGLSGNGAVVKSGGGSSTLTIGGGNSTGTFDGTVSNSAGTLSLSKTGTGTLTLTAAHSYNGGTTVNGGTLVLPAGSSIGTAASGRVNIAAGTLQLTGGSLTTHGTGVFLADAAPATLDFSAGSLTMSAPNQWWDVIVGQNAAASWNQTGGDAHLNIGGLYVGNWAPAAGTAISLSGGTFSINGTGGTPGRRLILSVRASSSLTIAGSVVATVPSLECGHSVDVTPAGVSSTVNLNGGTLLANEVTNPGTRTAIFNFNGGLLKTFDNSTTLMAGLTTANVRDGGARIDTNGQSSTITQPLVHSAIGGDAATDGGLIKSGAGTLMLAASCDFNGNTTVQDGLLRVNGALTASPSVTLAPNTGLGGTGVITGSVSAASATIEPGNSVGTLTIGSLDLTNGTLACEVDGAGADRLVVSGDLNLTGATLQVSEISPATFTGPVVIVSYTGILTGTFLPPTLPSGMTLVHDATAKEFRLVSGGDFHTWASANSITGGPDGDSDNDGIRNLVEYALALNPAASDGQAGSYNPSTGVISFTKRQEAVDNGDVTYVIETSPDLTNWAPAVTHPAGSTSITISTTLAVDGPKKFARLSVVTSATAP